MITLFIEQDDFDGTFDVMQDDGARQRAISGLWGTREIAARQCENAAHKLAEQRNQRAEWTVKPDAVAQREYDRRGVHGSRSAWIVA
jgi:hypothetical protein